MSLVGNIYETAWGRLVVHRDTPDGVFWESLPYGKNGSGAVCGPGARARFIAQRGEPVARMRFEGAYQLYTKARHRQSAAHGAKIAHVVRFLEGLPRECTSDCEGYADPCVACVVNMTLHMLQT